MCGHAKQTVVMHRARGTGAPSLQTRHALVRTHRLLEGVAVVHAEPRGGATCEAAIVLVEGQALQGHTFARASGKGRFLPSTSSTRESRGHTNTL
jgi:hypothetical protein